MFSVVLPESYVDNPVPRYFRCLVSLDVLSEWPPSQSLAVVVCSQLMVCSRLHSTTSCRHERSFRMCQAAERLVGFSPGLSYCVQMSMRYNITSFEKKCSKRKRALKLNIGRLTCEFAYRHQMHLPQWTEARSRLSDFAVPRPMTGTSRSCQSPYHD